MRCNAYLECWWYNRNSRVWYGRTSRRSCSRRWRSRVELRLVLIGPVHAWQLDGYQWRILHGSAIIWAHLPGHVEQRFRIAGLLQNTVRWGELTLRKFAKIVHGTLLSHRTWWIRGSVGGSSNSDCCESSECSTMWCEPLSLCWWSVRL